MHRDEIKAFRDNAVEDALRSARRFGVLVKSMYPEVRYLGVYHQEEMSSVWKWVDCHGVFEGILLVSCSVEQFNNNVAEHDSVDRVRGLRDDDVYFGVKMGG